MAAAGESLDLVDQPAASGAGGVLERLRAREEQRSQEAAKRLEELEVSSDPRESVAAFLASFGSQRQALQERLEAAGALPTGGAGELAAAKAVLEKLASDVAELEKAVAEAAYFLPQYDLRQCTLAVGALKEQQEAAAAALQPRKRFAFSRKAALAPGAPPAAPAAPPPPQQAPTGPHAPPPAAGAAAAQPPDGAPAGTASSRMNGTSSCSSSNGGASSSGTAIRGLVGQTIVHRCSTAGTEDCTLSDLECCTVYLLGPLAALFIHRLRGCRLYSGPVAGASFVEGAADCVLMLASRQVRIHSARGCDFYLRLKTNPIIEHSEGLRFAPYAFQYPGNAADLAAQGLDRDSGRWAEVQDFGWLRATPSPHWSLLPEAERVVPPAAPAGGNDLEHVQGDPLTTGLPLPRALDP